MMSNVNEIIFMALQLILSIAVFLITYYLIPWIKEKIGKEQYETIEKEVQKFVLAIQQMYPELMGKERLNIVTEKVKVFLASKNIQLTDEQIRFLIESAVKTMKMQEGNNG